MSTRIGLSSWVLAGLCMITGCAQDTDKLTQIVVVVDSDLPVPEELDNVQIEVTGTKQPHVFDEPVDQDQHKLPRSLGLVYSGGPLGPVRVVARGQLAGETRVERVAEVYFRKDRTLKLELPLTRMCADKPACESADQTCADGDCVPVAMSLTSFDGDDGPLFADAGPWLRDAGMPDGGRAPIEADGGEDAAVDAGVDAAPPAPPVCTIQAPADGDKFYDGDPIRFAGRCVGPGGEPVELVWRSSRSAKLGSGDTFTSAELELGRHEINLCARGSDACAGTIEIVVEELPAMSALISAIEQDGAQDNMFRADAQLVASGAGTGVPPLELSWTDSLEGKVATGATCTFDAPLPGRHTLRLQVKDARGRTAQQERTFVVHAMARDKLFETYDLANSVLSTSGKVNALASDGNFHYVGTDAGYLLQVVADTSEMMSPIVTPTATTPARPEVRGLFLHASSNTLYLATSSDVQTCDITNGNVKNCAKLMLGGFAAAMPRCVRRVNNEGTDYLLSGTAAGLWVGVLNMLDKGSLREASAEFNAMSESAGRLWFAGSTGLSSYSLGSAGLSGSPMTLAGSDPLHGVAASGDLVWVLPSSGIARYDAAADSWLSWTTSYLDADFGRLVHNEVRSLAITHPVIDGVAHDVIWAGTAAGLSRFDPQLSSFTTYTKADGLPDNSVLQVHALPSNELLIATSAGLAIHRGQ